MPDTADKIEEEFIEFAKTRRNVGKEVSKSETGANNKPKNANNIREKCTNVHESPWV